MMEALDRIDYEIVRQLRNNARLSNKELAATVGLAPSSCLVRVRGLQRDGILKGFHAEVNPASLGVGLQAMISIRLQRHSKSIRCNYFKCYIKPSQNLDNFMDQWILFYTIFFELCY